MSTSRYVPRRLLAAGALVTAAGLVLAGCAAGGESADESGASAEEIQAALQEPGELTIWSWGTAVPAQVAAFQEQYPDIEVTVENVGSADDEYLKLQNAVQAGTGAPDVVHIEYSALPQFALSDALVDLSAYGVGELEDLYTDSTWGQVNVNGGIYGLPTDSGPLAMFYRQDVFDEFGLTVPTTWEEYADVAEQLNAADPERFIAADSGDAGLDLALMWQAGAQPFSVEGDTNVTIDLQDEGMQRWNENWGALVEDGLVDSETVAWTDEWFQGLGAGKYATLISGGWMQGTLSTVLPENAGQWRVAPVPQYDSGATASAESGGSSLAVTAQSSNKLQAVGLAQWMNADDEGIQIAIEGGGFPSTVAQLEDPAFRDVELEYYGGQPINQVLTESAQNVVEGWSYLPYQVYANSVWTDTVGQAFAAKSDLEGGLEQWQQQLAEYGETQGFTVD